MSWKFWKSPNAESQGEKEAEKLPRPKEIPNLVGRFLVVSLGKDPDWVWNLRAAIRPQANQKSAWDVRVFDDREVASKGIKIENFNTLEKHPELVLFEGWFDKRSMKVELEEKQSAPKAA